MHRLIPCLFWIPSFALAEDPPELLSQAQVDGLLEDPQQSIALLQQSSSPYADGWKAYLQFTGQWPGVDAGPSPDIDQLMGNLREATNAPDSESDNGHYNTLTELLYDIRFSSEPHFIAPCWLFERHPDEAGTAFGSYYGSSRDGAVGFCQLKFAESEPFAELVQAKGALSSTFLVSGASSFTEPGEMPWCGTIRVGIYRNIAMQRVLSLLHPSRMQPKATEIRENNAAYLVRLKAWAGEDAARQELLDNYQTARHQFHPILVSWFTTNKGLENEQALEAAELWTDRTFNSYFEEDLRCLGLWEPANEP